MNLLLVALKKTREKVAINNKGICGNVQYYIHEITKHLGGNLCQEKLDNASYLTHKLIQRWPKCADQQGIFPIEKQWAEYELRAAKDELWSDPLRLELLDWCIKELENGH